VELYDKPPSYVHGYLARLARKYLLLKNEDLIIDTEVTLCSNVIDEWGSGCHFWWRTESKLHYTSSNWDLSYDRVGVIAIVSSSRSVHINLYSKAFKKEFGDTTEFLFKEIWC